MILKDFLKKVFNITNVYENESNSYFCPNLWEDYYCQIELIPDENKNQVVKIFNQIENLISKNENENGFTEIYERDKSEFSTLRKQININDFENIFQNSKLLKAHKIKYENFRMINCEDEKTKAFGISDFVIFYDIKESIVNNIWIDYQNFDSDNFRNLEENILEILSEIGTKYNLILVDWNKLEIVDLKNKIEIKKYCR